MPYVLNKKTPLGIDTMVRVKAKQRELGVEPDGIWRPKTEAAYQASLAGNAQPVTMANLKRAEQAAPSLTMAGLKQAEKTWQEHFDDAYRNLHERRLDKMDAWGPADYTPDHVAGPSSIVPPQTSLTGLRGLEQATSPNSPEWHWNDALTKGPVPSLTYIDPLQSDVTGYKIKMAEKDAGQVLNILDTYTSATDRAVFRLEPSGRMNTHTKAGNVPIGPHMNVKATPEDSAFTHTVASKLDHKEIPQALYDTFKDADRVAEVAKVGGTAIAAIGVAMDIYDIATAVSNDLTDSDQKLGKKTVSAISGAALSWAGSAIGAEAWAVGGAILGTALIPIPGLGTMIGGFIGGLAGGMIGASIGRGASGLIMNSIDWKE